MCNETSMELSFEPPLEAVYRKLSYKLHAFAKVSNCTSQGRVRITVKVFIILQFSYCPFLWVCQSIKVKSKINNLHDMAIRVINKDKESKFHKLLIQDKSVNVHYKICKYWLQNCIKFTWISPPSLWMTFSERKASFKKFLVLVDITKTRNSSVFKTRNIKTVHYGLKTTVYVDWKIWELVSQKMEDSENINIFKSDIELGKKR